MKLKRFSTKEVKTKKLKVRYYDHYMLNAGVRVVNEKNEIIGYLNFNQFMKLDLILLQNGYGYREYKIYEENSTNIK